MNPFTLTLAIVHNGTITAHQAPLAQILMALGICFAAIIGSTLALRKRAGTKKERAAISPPSIPAPAPSATTSAVPPPFTWTWIRTEDGHRFHIALIETHGKWQLPFHRRDNPDEWDERSTIQDARTGLKMYLKDPKYASDVERLTQEGKIRPFSAPKKEAA